MTQQHTGVTGSGLAIVDQAVATAFEAWQRSPRSVLAITRLKNAVDYLHIVMLRLCARADGAPPAAGLREQKLAKVVGLGLDGTHNQGDDDDGHDG